MASARWLGMAPGLKNLTLTGLQAGYGASLGPSWARFVAAASSPERAQGERLKRILRANAGTAFGGTNGFERIDSVHAYQSRIPIVRFDQMAPWVDRVSRGESNVLTHDPVFMMETTSGSTSANKLIPFTRSLLREIATATQPWLFDLLRRCPGLASTRSYWAISPATRLAQRTDGGIPIGVDDDTAYFGNFSRWVLGTTMAVPSRIARIHNVDHWRWELSRHLIAAEDLGLISVWSPTFITRIMEFIEAGLEDLMSTIEPQRARRIQQALEHRHGTLTADVLWPRLALLSCWADGPSKAFLPSLRRWFPHTRIQPKGLLATEGVVSFPLWNREGSVLAVAGHFLEFVDVQHPNRRPLLAHELKEGCIVSPVLTTSGGLYRYHLQDRLCCVGRYRATPCVRFEGRLDCVSDLVGEKIDAQLAERAIACALALRKGTCRFAMLAPELGSPSAYHLYLEGKYMDEDLIVLGQAVEEELLGNVHYAYARRLGQLGPVKTVLVANGAQGLERRRAAEGGRIGVLKPTPLDRRTGWTSVFLDGGEG